MGEDWIRSEVTMARGVTSDDACMFLMIVRIFVEYNDSALLANTPIDILHADDLSCVVAVNHL